MTPPSAQSRRIAWSDTERGTKVDRISHAACGVQSSRAPRDPGSEENLLMPERVEIRGELSTALVSDCDQIVLVQRAERPLHLGVTAHDTI